MTTRFAAATAVTVFLLAICAYAEGLTCAGCAGACPPAPANCPLSREPCGCCDVCALTMGERCHGWSAGCGPGLMCLTPVGPFPLRPPPESGIRGRCVLSSIPNYSPSTQLTPALLIPTIPSSPVAPSSTIGPKVMVGRRGFMSKK